MRNATPPIKFDLRDALRRARRLATASLGESPLNLPFVSVAVTPKDKEKRVARELLIRLKDRRVLNAWECCDGCIDQALASLQEIRRLLVDKQAELADLQDGPLYVLVDAMAVGIRQFLTFEQRLQSAGVQANAPSEFGRPQDTRQAYFDSLEILRGHLSRRLGQIAKLAGMDAPNDGIIVHDQATWQLEAYQDPQLTDGGAQMSIAEQGFLSPDIARFAAKHRADNKAVFDLADDLNRTAQRLMLGTEVRMEGDVLSEKNLAQLLFVRALSNFQGVVLMAERGAIVEARTLARTCLETVFALVAAVKMDASFIDRMVASEMGSKSKSANWLLNRADRADFLYPEADEKLQAFIDRLKADNEPTGAFGSEDMARRAGLDSLYMFFRQFSSDAAHPMLEALNRYIDNGKGGVGPEIIWGPNCGAAEIDDTVIMACCFLLTAAVALNEIANVAAIGDALGAHYEVYKGLIAAKSPDAPPA